MGFPTPSETFTSLDVAGLAARGVDIRVHALRPRHRDHTLLRAQRGLDGVVCRHLTAVTPFAAVAAALRSPGASLALVWALLRGCWRQPEQLVKSLLLAPRALEVYGEIRRRRPDVVHLCWAHLPAMVGFLVQAGLQDVAVSMSFSAYDIDLRYGLTPPVARRAQLLRTLAHSNVAELVSWLGVAQERIEVIPDGIRLQLFSDAGGRHPGRIVTIGRLVHAKGMDAVIDAFVLVRREFPHASLVILGDGPEGAQLASRAAAHGLAAAISFRGHQPQEQVARELLDAEVFLFMSRSERLPNVLKEALAAGCACVTTSTFGVEELIPDGDHGAVVAIDDVEAAARAATRYLQDARLRHETGCLGRQHVVSRFDLERSLDRYIELWSHPSANARRG